LWCVMSDPNIIPLSRIHRRCIQSCGVSRARAGRGGLFHLICWRVGWNPVMEPGDWWLLN
jgi:hypothetical protein